MLSVASCLGLAGPGLAPAGLLLLSLAAGSVPELDGLDHCPACVYMPGRPCNLLPVVVVTVCVHAATFVTYCALL